ncbi:TrkA family potassium uptake protein [Streptomyces sp. CAI-21]|uniref:TrkA family potassium uptake protein n=1 Tax=Streptomyces fungicidicus TaxID=68203 RepID=A0ACC7Y487_9ACTN|nr:MULTISPECIES: TrkA family potassium uptake protein [Streptomyces]MBO1282623.1 TrkA family potassium uptake protein [Streptomyces sampsonii]NUW09408.1 TrkA family potassium uptake protein [Streptomyces sp. CAI-21]NVI32125.1 TrkA family potassium uptake protein [Streptomyces sp. CAI-17]MBF4135650.1 TrkA family potassium uptake protein [Streptomyces albidoflavus]NUV76541.1 TrkA family potassium uptake protein [Streptomyces fungicidicus]
MARKPSPRKRRTGPRGSVVVIGLGRFGRALALELVDEDTEVLGIDESAEVVQALSGHLTHAVRADSTKEDALRQLGVHEFDRAVVAIGTDLEASILTASLLISFGIENVWAKAISEAHGRILTQLGVHHVVYPEHDMGQRVAHLVRGRMLDYIEFEDDFALVKTTPPADIVGLPLANSAVRTRHGVTVVAVKRPSEGFTYATPETVVEADDTIIVAGRTRAAERFSELQ